MWLVSKKFDWLWFQAGLWLLPVVGVAAFMPEVARLALIGATMLLWLGHRFASAQSAYFLPEFRDLIRLQPVRFIAAPLVIFAAVLAFMYVPLGGDATLITHLRILTTVFFVINTYHFGIQHFGVLSIYQIRAKQKPNDAYKRLQRRLCLVLGGFFVATGQIAHGAQLVRDSLLATWIPDGLLFEFRAVMSLTALAVAGWWIWREAREAPRSPPKMLYIAGLGSQAALAFVLDPLSFVLLWGVPHWLISVALAGHMAERSRRRGFAWSFLSLAALSLVAAPLFYAVATTAPIAAPSIYLPLMGLLEHPHFARAMTGVAFASVYCHFVLDRAIFRFSQPDVRKVTAPLVFGERVPR